MKKLKEAYLIIVIVSKALNIAAFHDDDGHFVTLSNCQNHKIFGNNIFVTSAVSSRHCAMICLAYSGCTGFNIEKQHTDYRCEFKQFSSPISHCTDASVVSAPGINFYVKGKLFNFKRTNFVNSDPFPEPMYVQIMSTCSCLSLNSYFKFLTSSWDNFTCRNMLFTDFNHYSSHSRIEYSEVILDCFVLIGEAYKPINNSCMILFRGTSSEFLHIYTFYRNIFTDSSKTSSELN